ncbi:MAG: hypothetical protein GX977_04000 [Firmicutes bacterium]|nr:hypothetical protein [Bacillota bacterium]
MKSPELKEVAKKIGFDIVGIASMDRFSNIPPEQHPLSILPGAKSIIALGCEIPRGTFRGIEEGTLWMRASRQVSPKYTYELARFIEDKGWEAVPMSPLAPERWPDGVPVAPDRVAPNVSPSLEHAAVAAGLGEIGFCRTFLSPIYGPRVSLGMIITDAPLDADPILDVSICPGLECLECVKACPLDAISPDKTEEIIVSGKKMLCAHVNYKACRLCPNGVYLDESSMHGTPNTLTAACIRSCIVQLEETGKLQKKYKTPFRIRPAWSLGILDE